MNGHNSISDTFRKKGIEVYSQIIVEIKGDSLHNPKVKSLIEKVNQLKQSIKDDELKIEGNKK